MANSLTISNTIELLGADGGVPSVIPACAGAIFLLADDGSYDLGTHQPTGDLNQLAAAREVLEQAVDQDTFTITWSRDPGTGTRLPLILDCFRAQPSKPVYAPLAADQGVMWITLTIPALPYGRSDAQYTPAFTGAVPQTPT